MSGRFTDIAAVVEPAFTRQQAEAVALLIERELATPGDYSPHFPPDEAVEVLDGLSGEAVAAALVEASNTLQHALRLGDAREGQMSKRTVARIPTARGDVEVIIRPGLATFDVLGLPDGRVREVRERVRAALVNAGREFPLQEVTVTVPRRSQRRLVEGALDLAIAEGVLEATGQEPLAHTRPVAGELRLSGEVVGG